MASTCQSSRRTPAMKTVGGLVVPKYLFSDENCLSGLRYQATADDIFIVTYPKSGTTWMQYIVWEILNDGAPPPPMNDMLSSKVPFLEFTGSKPVEKLPLPRAIKTHIHFQLHPYHHLAKYIYVARNPKDTCISYFNHVRQMPSMYKYADGSLHDFFESFLEGDLPYGGWFDHVLSWYVHKDDPNVLFLTYEGMKKDYEDAVMNVAKFLGEEYYRKLSMDPTLLHQILENTSFENMKTINFYMPKEGTKIDPDGGFPIPHNEEEEKMFQKVNFFWKGKVGNWKNYLSEEQVRRLDDDITRRPRGREIAALWEN